MCISEQTQDPRPNIFLFITDEQRIDTIRALGYPYMDTPNLDKLVETGVAFTHCYTTGASCAPARASLFSGMFPNNTGVRQNGDTWRYSWVEKLKNAGYYTVNFGKMHTFPYEEPLGYCERFVVENKDRFLEGRYFFDRWDMFLQAQGLVKQQRSLYRQRADYQDSLGAFDWELPEHTHSDAFVGDTARKWIENRPKIQQPVFIEVGFPGPHPPFDPPKRYSALYADRDIPVPKVSDGYVETLTPYLQSLRRDNINVDHDSLVWKEHPTREQLRKMRQYYYANMTLIDEKIGDILRALEEKGYMDNAVVIFTSDHGDCLGDHANVEKWCMYEEVTNVPMIVWSSNGRYLKGVKRDQLCQWFDIAPVIMELAGVEVPSTWEAKSLTPLLTGESDAEIRDFVYCEQCADSNRCADLLCITMIRDKRWKLVFYLGDDENGELYDLESPEGENKNLWHDAQYADIKNHLIFQMLKWRNTSQYYTMTR